MRRALSGFRFRTQLRHRKALPLGGDARDADRDVRPSAMTDIAANTAWSKAHAERAFGPAVMNDRPAVGASEPFKTGGLGRLCYIRLGH